MNIMKAKHLLYSLFFASSLTFAGGIPTIDIASIAQMAKEAATQAQQFRQQMQNLRMQIDEARKHNGIWGEISGLTNIDANNYLLDRNFDSNIEKELPKLRNQFQLKSDNPETQKRYDSLLKDYAFQETVYNNSVKREKTITQLMQKLDKAETPAQKATIANSIEAQKLQMDNETKLIASRQYMMKQQQEIEAKIQQDKWLDEILKDNF